MAEIISLDPVCRHSSLVRAGEVIRAGGIIVYPTETFYAVGADPGRSDALQRLFTVKSRDPQQPLLLLLGDRNQVAHWASAVTEEAERVMEKYWPGPVTMVFQAKKTVLPLLTGGKGTIGLRVPGSVLTRQILNVLGPLTGTSANVSGAQSLRTAGQARTVLGNRVDLILDGGVTPGGKPSTVVDVRSSPFRIIRQGAVTVTEAETT